MQVSDSGWRVEGGAHRLLFRSWESEAAVVCYDTLSGDTHLLNLIAAQALICLQQESPIQLDALVDRVAASLDIDVDDELVHFIEDTLSDFSRRGVLART
jgi:PqqD family protein of HPr-rel-A system